MARHVDTPTGVGSTGTVKQASLGIEGNSLRGTFRSVKFGFGEAAPYPRNG
jgi:hypothetical protein